MSDESSQPVKRQLKSVFSRQLLAPLLCGLLIGCVGTAPHSQESTYPNTARVEVPVGWRVGSTSHNAAMRLLEFVPQDQSVDSWTDMITIIVVYHRSAADFSDFLNSLQEHLSQGCEVPPVLSKSNRLTDHGYEAATQTVTCGKSKRFGKGEIMMQKVMMGDNAIFDVQRAWRFAPTQRSEDLPLSEAQREDGAAYLDTVWLCNLTVESPGCPLSQPKL
jgi:hypothetical protein